jgi:hypothetical protein
MQSLHSLAATALFVSTALAQVNPFVFYPQDPERQALTCTSFVGRPDVSAAAEALMEISAEHFRGISTYTAPTPTQPGIIRLFGVYHWIADERLSTIETYDLVIRQGAPGGGPDMSPAAEYLRVTGLTTPPSVNPNRGTWIAYDGFGIQGGLVIQLPNQLQMAPDRFYVGVGLPANPLWPATDGHSLFRADMLNAGTGATVGENHRAGAPDPTWAGRIGQPSFSTPWTYVLGPFVTSPNLHLGGVDPTSNRLGAPGANLSMNGLFPDISGQPRRDGLTVRVTDNLLPFGFVTLGGNLGFENADFFWALFPPVIGYSFIGTPSQVLLLGGDFLTLGVKEWTVALPNTLSPSLVGSEFAFQAIVWDLNNLLPSNWTNAQRVVL